MNCYAAYANDEITRSQGSSGGLFPVISKAFINAGGVVYASVYCEDFSVEFKRIADLQNLNAAFTSKYVQSRSAGVYEQIEEDLKNEKAVLFCGTPCQVNALSNYLDKKRMAKDKLLSVSIICHGVPSEVLLKQFLKEYSKDKICHLNMRSKAKGWAWGSFSWAIDEKNRETRVIKQSEVPYMQAFLANMSLRYSCYQCQSKKNTKADIILGDFWGVEQVIKEIDFRNGVSCVIAKTEKGQEWMDAIAGQVQIWKVEYSSILATNPALEHSVKMPYGRKRFYKRIQNRGSSSITDCIGCETKRTLPRRIINKLYSYRSEYRVSIDDLYPENDKKYKFVFAHKEKCCGCMACHSVCARNAIEIIQDKEGFYYPAIDAVKCVNCGQCEKVCPQSE